MNNDQNKFKIVLMGIFGFFIFFGLIAFSTYKSSSSTSTSNVEINIWGTIDKNIFDAYITKYKQDTTTELKLTYTFKSLSTIDAQLVEAIAVGKAPDAILIPHSLEKRYLDKVYMIPFTSVPVRTFQDTFAQEANLYLQPEGIFALPFFIDPIIMYWNRDTFSNINIGKAPSKWSDFLDIAGKISQTDNNANIKKSAIAFGEFINVNNAKPILSTLIMQAGSPIVDYEGSLLKSKIDFQPDTMSTVPAENSLTFFTDFSNPKKKVYSWNRSLPNSKDAFVSDDLAVYFGFASEFTNIQEKNPNINFDVALIPQVDGAKTKITYGDLYGFSILKNSANIVPTFNMISTLIGSVSASTFLEFANVGPARLDLISAGTPNPIRTIFYKSALISKGWIDPDAIKTSKIFQDMIENVTTGKLDVTQSVSKASLEMDNLLQ